MTRKTLSFDGFGINGPDEYRTRIATFTNDEAGKEWGRLFEAAPEILDLLCLALPYVEEAISDPAYKSRVVSKLANQMREAIEPHRVPAIH